MKRFLSFAVAITLVVTLSTPTAIAAEIAGTKCTKVGITKDSKGKRFTCIKLGKKLYWNNGMTIAKPSTKPTTASNLTFFQAHRNGNTEELLKIVISAGGVLQNKTKLTSGPKFGLRVVDMRKNTLLLEVDAVKSQLYVMQPGGGTTSLGIEKNGGIPTDSRNLDDLRLSLDGKSIFAFDFDMDFYRIDISSATPVWTRLFTGPQLKGFIGALGGDSSYDWVQGFEITGTDEFLLMTKNSFKGTLRFWNVKTSLVSENVPRVSKVGEFASSNVLGDDFVGMSISPSSAQVAILHTASTLTPKSRLLIYSLAGKTFKEVPVSQLYDGTNFNITWLDEDKLLTTIDLVWTSDKDGGRITCLLDLKTAKPCVNIVGVSGYTLVGSR
jgi:hypothetical protein